MIVEPPHHGGHHGREDRGGRGAEHDPEDDLELDKAGRAACPGQGEGDEDRTGQDDKSWAKPVDDRSPGHASEGHGQESEGHGAGDPGPRPAGVLLDGHQQHRKGEHGANGNAAQKAARGNDHPAIALRLHATPPFARMRNQ